MYTESVIFTGHTGAFDVNTRYGQKTKNVFVDSQGREFQVWKTDIAAQILATMGQSVTVQYEAKQNGQYTNYDVKAVTGGVLTTPMAPQLGTPNNAVTGPGPNVPNNLANPPVFAQAPPQQAAGESQDDRQLRIMRQNAVGNAVLAFGAAGIDPIVNRLELLEFAQEVLLDFYINGFSLEAETVTVDAGETAGPVA